MSDINRIKELMFIKEQSEEKKVVTTPYDMNLLIKSLLSYNKKDNIIGSGIEFDDIALGRFVEFISRYTSSSDSTDIDFIRTFIVNNADRLQDEDTDISNYIIPKLTTYIASGEEVYTARVGQDYEYKIGAYSEDYVWFLFNSGTIQIYDGIPTTRLEFFDTWDNEQTIHEIKELSPNEISENITKKTPSKKNVSERVKDYIDSESDLTILEEMKVILEKKIQNLTSKNS